MTAPTFGPSQPGPTPADEPEAEALSEFTATLRGPGDATERLTIVARDEDHARSFLEPYLRLAGNPFPRTLVSLVPAHRGAHSCPFCPPEPCPPTEARVRRIAVALSDPTLPECAAMGHYERQARRVAAMLDAETVGMPPVAACLDCQEPATDECVRFHRLAGRNTTPAPEPARNTPLHLSGAERLTRLRLIEAHVPTYARLRHTALRDYRDVARWTLPEAWDPGIDPTDGQPVTPDHTAPAASLFGRPATFGGQLIVAHLDNGTTLTANPRDEWERRA